MREGKKRRERLRQTQSWMLAQSSQSSNDDSPLGKKSKPAVEKAVLQKQDFGTMEVLGQFNLGFILARCKKQNLWILDQHGCDEKFNFERMIRTTKIHEQKLIAPLPLELSPSEEDCVLEHMEIFEQNGFRFQHDPSKPPRNRLALTALPHSGSGGDGKKAVQFGPEDVGALCSMLGAEGGSVAAFGAGAGTGADGSGMYGNNAVRRYAGDLTSAQGGDSGAVIARLPKAVAMFASRACRHSIMIGTALNKTQMSTVVRKMLDVQNPYNCPHGRPTMKHVSNLLAVMVEDENVMSEQQAPTGMSLTQASFQ
jgi:DNA mismatch repair protein PMS2